jgi:hypothetical protein
MKLRLLFFVLLGTTALTAQSPHSRKQLLAIGEQKGYRHDAVSHALATIERLGHDSGLWDTTIRTDTEALTKKKLEFNAKNLNDAATLKWTPSRKPISSPLSTTTAKASSASIARRSPSPHGRNTET